jgi:hypothetical protein
LIFTPISLTINDIGEDATNYVENAVEANRIFFKNWTQRKHFIVFLSQLSNPLPPDHVHDLARVNIVNVRRVLELEEMKREIASFL